jgi:hypothetical protein
MDFPSSHHGVPAVETFVKECQSTDTRAPYTAHILPSKTIGLLLLAHTSGLPFTVMVYSAI